jgi:hypothetical protein
MAELFNPFNRRVTGEAFNGQAPVQLRVEEGSASRDQVRAVQDAFARFARRATFSHVPNPTESGVLGDGSPTASPRWAIPPSCSCGPSSPIWKAGIGACWFALRRSCTWSAITPAAGAIAR